MFFACNVNQDAKHWKSIAHLDSKRSDNSWKQISSSRYYCKDIRTWIPGVCMLLTERKRSIFFVEAAYRADHLLHCKGDKNACYEDKHWDKKHLKSRDMFPYWETNIWSLGRCCPTDWADTCFDPITRIFAILWNAGVLSADWEDIRNGSDG